MDTLPTLTERAETPSGAPGVSVLIVSYNTRALTVECLRSVFAQTRTPIEVIVVDNASADGSAEAIAAEFPRVRLIALDENIGFAAGNNRAAREASAPWILLLNPDTVVLDGAIDRLVAFAEANPSSGIYGGRTLFPDRTLNPTSCWGRPTLWSVVCRAAGLSRLAPGSRLLDPESLGGWRRDTVRDVDIVTGCFLLIRRSLWDDLGGFDERFFMYGEEADLCLRARAADARPVFYPGAEIIHYDGASERVPLDRMVRLLTARIALMRKHWSGPAAAIGVGALTLGMGGRRAITAIVRLGTAGWRGRDAAEFWSGVWMARSTWRGARAPEPVTQPSAEHQSV